MSAARTFALRVLLLAFSVAIFLGTGEIALRVIYRDAGKRTLGGPGGHSFEHLATDGGDQRGRFDAGPKTAGKPRIMIVGDSITWGQGVRNWQEAWPEQLAIALERAGTPHEMDVLAMPGRDIPGHVEQVEHWAPLLKPDVFIYQWYVNDIEVDPHRPRNTRWWQRLSVHERLRRSSYLYYFLDNRLSTYLPQPDRSYVEYILEDYAPGTLEWAEFERYFHQLALRAVEVAPTRLLVIYPQVPFRGSSPLKLIHDRVIALAGPHRLAIPPAAWIRHAGTPVESADAPWHQAVRVDASTHGPVMETRDYYLPAGESDIIVTASLDAPGEMPSLAWATLEIVDAASNEILSTSPVPAPAPTPGWQELSTRVTVTGQARPVRLRLRTAGATAFSVAGLALPVDYGFNVVDLTDVLNSFDTHASIFDAHPNERAHKVVAERVFDALREAESRH